MTRLILIFSLAVGVTAACGDAPRKGSPRISCEQGELYDPNSRECVAVGTNNGGTNNGGTNNATTNNSTTNNSTTNNSTTNNATTNNSTTNNSTTNNSTTNNSTTNNSSNNSTTNNSTTNNSTSNNSTVNNTPGCSVEETFFGQIGGTGPHDGGTPTSTPVIGDTGLLDVYNAVPSTPDDPTTPTVNEGEATLSPGIDVSGAAVVATASDADANLWFWLQDDLTTMSVYLSAAPPVTIKVGQRISFRATEVLNYDGHPEITEMSNFRVTASSGTVPIEFISNRAPQVSDYGRIIRFGGEVTGSGTPCGANAKCFPASSPEGGTATLRTSDASVGVGTCFTFVGPGRSFPGELDPTASPQLDVLNPRWISIQ